MKEKELRRSLAVFPIGTVMQLTELSARQIRYYEEQQLVIPKRSTTNRRMYSLNDVDRLLEIKDFLNEGLSVVAIKRLFSGEASFTRKDEEQTATNGLTDEDVRRILYNEFLQQNQWRTGANPQYRSR